MEDVYVCPKCGRFVDYAGIFILPQNIAKEDLQCVLCYECREEIVSPNPRIKQQDLFDGFEIDNPSNGPVSGELF